MRTLKSGRRFEFHAGVDAGGVEARGGVEPRERGAEVRVEELVGDDAAPPARNSNLQADFNAAVFDASSSAVLRELDESHRFVQKSAESTSM